MPTITQKDYQTLFRRQNKVEAELDVLKKIVMAENDESVIKPLVLKKWERISRDMDHGKGMSFASLREMRKWLKNL